MMKCIQCRTGDMLPGHTMVTLNRHEAVLVVKDVPAFVCDNCGEYYLSLEVAEQLRSKANEAETNGTELEVIRYRVAS